MNRLCFTVAVCLGLIGCDSPGPAPVAEPSQPTGKADAPDAAQLFPLPKSAAASIPDADRPATIDAFRSEFIRRFEMDMYSPFVELAYWAASTDEQRFEYLKGVQANYTMPAQGNRALVKSPADVELVTLAEYGDWAYFPKQGDQSVKLVPSPTHVMRLTGHYDDTFKVTNYFAVGEHQGKYYFCTIDHK